VSAPVSFNKIDPFLDSVTKQTYQRKQIPIKLTLFFSKKNTDTTCVDLILQGKLYITLMQKSPQPENIFEQANERIKWRTSGSSIRQAESIQQHTA